jgi:diguanylate cyclase (GGDEF)-like protein
MLKLQQEELRAAEQKASTTNALLEATLERMQQGVMMVNSDRIVEVCNKRAIELLGLPESLMNSKPSFEEVLAYQWSTNEFRHTSDSLKDFIKAGGITDQPQCYDRKRPDGRVIEVQSVPIAGGGVLRTYTDITERRRVEERIRHVARHDGLTSLANRDVFLEHLAEAFPTDDAPTSAPFAVHYIDLDRFKPINDRHGHGIGDKVLTIVAERMRRVARGKDVVARMGGDEFAILQYDVGHLDAALGLAARILASISEPMEVESLRLQVGASIGIATFPGPATDVDSLLRDADAAMYAAKSSAGESIRAHR